MTDPLKARVWSSLNPRGIRLWHFLCPDCAENPDKRANFFSTSTTTRWDWSVDDAVFHLETYH